MLEVRIMVTLGERRRVVTGRGRKGTSGLLSCSIYQVTWACSPVDHLVSYILVISELSECATLQQKKSLSLSDAAGSYKHSEIAFLKIINRGA